uniref:Complement C3-like n=1 Tax=Sparus aurata TaxID=8175 RepID=A0A671YJF1_SPAAU
KGKLLFKSSVTSTLTTSILHLSLLCSQVMSAPNWLRVGTTENIFVECQDCTGEDIRVEIVVMNFPTKTRRLAFTDVTLTSGNQFQELAQIKIPAGDFSKDPNRKQYVSLQAHFPGRVLEQVVLVSFQSGYIFIQTDKTLYTPGSTVHYRMFAVTPQMKPVERDEGTNSLPSIAIEIVVLCFIFNKYRIDNFGLWKVVAKFSNVPQQSFSAEFEVREYVLPSFEVKLTPVRSFFYVDSPELTVNIRATYTFGEEVNGVAYVVFGVVQDGTKRSFPGSLQRVQIAKGDGQVTLKREHITETFENILDLVGSSIYVSVSVLTESGSEMVEAESRGIQIVTSPYTIHLRKTARYFKPGMPFTVVVEVVNPDDSPAKGILVAVDGAQMEGSTADNGMVKLTISTEENINSLTITQHVTFAGVDASVLALGDNLKVNLYLEQLHQDITYLILSRGQLVKKGRYRRRGQVINLLMVLITKEMLPSFRIIAYYHTDDNEVVSDSVWVDVKDSCMGSLKLEPARPTPSYEPGKMFPLKVTGDPEATVGLVAVDKGVYILNNKHRLTQKKVWDIVEKSDTGCTPGGGRDAMSVFYDAGLMFESNRASGTPFRQELKCPTPTGSRRKRSNTIMNITSTLDQMQRECCLDGMKKTPLSYTCETRSEYIVDGAACVDAFLYCCKEMESQLADRHEENLKLARSEEDDNSYDSEDMNIRTQFPESWLWSDIKLYTTTFEKRFPLKDSITTWQFTGISLSRTNGICVGEPLEAIVRKDFFIDLRLPYSAVRGEQIEIKAILHNYSPDPVTVSLESAVCSSASKRRKYRQEVNVGPETTRSVPYIIIPMKQGQHPIEVKAVVKNSHLNDWIKKMLRVVVRPKVTKGAVQRISCIQIMNSGIARKLMAPKTPRSTEISVTGREHVSALVENAISGQSMGTLIRQPKGCGEQNMIGMTLTVIAVTYLDKTNQWEAVGLQKRDKAFEHIKTGYVNQLKYRKDDGSFAVWPYRDGSTWLTAYVAKVFAMANNLVAVQHDLICDAVRFLIVNAQQNDGRFREVGEVDDGQMMVCGGVRGPDSGASMTAFCLIAMQESRALCDATVDHLQASIDRAVAYLERRLPDLTNPYAVAITSYALANENKLNLEILKNFVSSESSHWPVPRGHIYTLEATAYALLALVKVKVSMSHLSFTRMSYYRTSFCLTKRATIMVYQAVAEYWAYAKEPEYNLNVDISLPGRSKPEKYNFNRDNHYTTRTSRKCILCMLMVSLYYTLPTEKESDCQKFNLAKIDLDYVVHFLCRYKDMRDATMSILDIGLLTGFTANTDDLNLLSKGHARTIANYEMNTVLSERGSLIIYLDKVSHKRPEEITFRIHQKFDVGVLQPAAVSVYEYYDRDIITTKEALLRFTVVSFLGKLIFNGVQGHFYASIKISIFKTLRMLDTTRNFAHSITRVSTCEHEH